MDEAARSHDMRCFTGQGLRDAVVVDFKEDEFIPQGNDLLCGYMSSCSRSDCCRISFEMYMLCDIMCITFAFQRFNGPFSGGVLG